MSSANKEISTSFNVEDWHNPEYRQQLVEAQNWEERGVGVNSEIGAGVVVFGVGKRISSDELPYALEEHFNKISQQRGVDVSFNVQDLNTGFNESYWTDPLPSTKDELIALQLGSIERVAHESLKVAKEATEVSGAHFEWGEVSDLDVVGVAITAPGDALQIEQQVREVLGLRDDAVVLPVSSACNSSAKAFEEIIRIAPKGSKCSLISIELMNAFREKIAGNDEWVGVSDEASLSFFSDTVTGFTFVAGTFDYKGGVWYEFVDEKGNLAAVNTGGIEGEKYVYPDGTESTLIYRYHNTLITKLHDLDKLDNSMMRMKPRQTAYMFLKFFENMYNRFRAYRDEKGVNEIHYDAILTHRPSELLYNRMETMLDPEGTRMEWKRELGNSPCSIFNFEMKDKLGQFTDGSNILFAFFGAGATGQMYSAQVKSLARVMAEIETGLQSNSL